jgi:cell division protein FtsA
MHKIDMEKEYVVGLDIGSSRVTIAVGLRGKDSVSILGVETKDVGANVKDGDILNYIEVGKAIESAKRSLEQELGLRIESAYVGVSGKSVYSVRYEDYVDVTDPSNCVRENEMRELHHRIELVTSASGDEIVERIPLRYRLDNKQEVKNPIGCYGHKLSATYLLVLISKQQIDMVNHALFHAGIRIEGLCVNPTLLPDILLTDNEFEEGVMIVDLGGDLTDISIVREGKLSYFSSLPIGASSIDRDLYEHLQVPRKDVERYKHRHGRAIAACVPEDTAFTVQTAGHAKRNVLQRNVAVITEERLKDIISFVAREVKGAQYSNKIHCGVVLTGGSAYLNDIDELFARELNMEVRLGGTFSGIDDDSQEKVSFPEAAVVGLLNYGAKHKPCNVVALFSQPVSPTPVTPTPVPPTPAQPEPIIEIPKQPVPPQEIKTEPIPQVTPTEPPVVVSGETDEPQPPTIADPVPSEPESVSNGENEGAPEDESGKGTQTVVNDKGNQGDKPKPKEKGKGFISRLIERGVKAVDGLFEKNDYL